MAPFFLYLHYVLPLVRQKSFKVSKEAKVWAHAFSPQIECKEEAHTHTHTHTHTDTHTHRHTHTHTHTHTWSFLQENADLSSFGRKLYLQGIFKFQDMENYDLFLT